MPKDYTDYILMVLGAGDRVYHLFHIRNTKALQQKNDARKLKFRLNGHKYIFNMDRAYRIRWAPWPKLLKRPDEKLKVKTKNGFKIKVKKPILRIRVISSLIEFFRSKKIGLLLYQEPCTNRCPGCKLKCEDIPAQVEPMHISRIHQPTGVMKG